jgi:hypothetical protein
MGFLSVVINIITLFVVAALFYIARELYRTRPDRALSASEAFNLMWIEPSTVTHSFFNDEPFGPIGNFYGYSWGGGVDTTNFAE